MPKPAADYANAPLPEVRVMTNRMLSAKSTEAVLNAIDKIEHIRQVNMYGESLPAKIGSGPGKGLDNNHSERQVINVSGREVELRCLVGTFFIELDFAAVEDPAVLDAAVAEIRKACDATVPFGYTLEIGRYSKYRPSLNDYRSA